MRQILDFNENWWFIHADVDVSEARPGEGELVSLPHTWNCLLYTSPSPRDCS